MEKKVAFGGICGEFLARWEPSSSSWKTRQSLLLGGLATFSGQWPREGGMQNGLCWARVTSAPHISANGSGFWLATPTAKANQLSPGMMKWPACRRWVASFPTPIAHDAKCNGGPAQLRRRHLNGVVGGRLNPQWVEWLMGWPVNWTDAKGSSPLEMDKFHEWQRQHSPFSGTD